MMADSDNRFEFFIPENDTNGTLGVKMNGQLVGAIVKVSGGWRYLPKGSGRGGVVYGSVEQVKESIVGVK